MADSDSFPELDPGASFGPDAAGCPPLRLFGEVAPAAPALQLCSNGHYHALLGAAGTGYSRCGEVTLTRWREDATRDQWGAFCYLRDVDSGAFWSATRQPAPAAAGRYRSAFWDAGVLYACAAQDIDSRLTVAVAADDVEVRRLTLSNRSSRARTLEATSYAEVVLGPAAADLAHPAFAKLFVETEILPAQQAILCTRRSGSQTAAPWMCHFLVAIDGAPPEQAASYETDRVRFIGRGRTLADPQALQDDAPLSGSQGSVLDPIVAIQVRMQLAPHQSATFAFVTGSSPSRAACLELIERYRQPPAVSAVFGQAWARSRRLRQQLHIDDDAALARYGQLADAIVYASPALRGEPALVAQNRRDQSGLWRMSISGDWPIVLLQLGAAAEPDWIRQLLQAHAYWRAKGLRVDLVICNQAGIGGRPALQAQVEAQVQSQVQAQALALAGADDDAKAANVLDQPGGVFVRLAAALPAADHLLLQAVARVVLDDAGGSLAAQLARRCPVEHHSAAAERPAAGLPSAAAAKRGAASAALENLQFFNGIGGFSADGREYVVRLAAGLSTPQPWINVLANPGFGSLVSASGGACSWSENAQEFRLTPWSNDAISDLDGEAFYLRDDASGAYWSPTVWPRRGSGAYECRHGFGYSVFTHAEQGIASSLRMYVAADAPLKFAVLRVRNDSAATRRLSVTGYVEWVLGESRATAAPQVVTALDAASGALLARNAYSAEFGERVVFFDAGEQGEGGCSFTCDRGEFIGREGTLEAPAAMAKAQLGGRSGAALDPCAAWRIPFELAPGAERELVFRLGAAASEEDARSLLERFRGAAAAQQALAAVTADWQQTLGAFHVASPDPAFDLLANGWLLYQTLACRLWARNAFYQSSGAFGFRDQLQDAMALVHARPELVRAHLLLCASRQFREGDVQHWWHPPGGRGVRTRCSDDFLWLPFVVCRYVAASGDAAVLGEAVPFLEGRALREGEESYYELPASSAESATLYQHCVRAIQHGLRFGAHGLPLMGSGDWNDGMNKVGIGGKGESVWLGFFLYDVLLQFAALPRQAADPAFAERCRREAAQLRANLEQHGWDGAWYRRAYFDDGSVLGSSANTECRIDSIAQSWAVLSGAGEPQRARQALAAVLQQLVQHRTSGDGAAGHAPGGGVLKLLAPPFDTSTPDPGYIQAYVPGVRENGAQYTHAAMWVVMAFAALGDGERAVQLLSMMNPVNHALDRESVTRYQIEPYVIASDVYALAPHAGRGGWSWYSGSAGWMVRAMGEAILGVRQAAGKLVLEPCIPAHWSGFTLRYRYQQTEYAIRVSRGAGGRRLTLDGVVQDESVVVLQDDRQPHVVELQLPSAPNEAKQEPKAKDT